MNAVQRPLLIVCSIILQSLLCRPVSIFSPIQLRGTATGMLFVVAATRRFVGAVGRWHEFVLPLTGRWPAGLGGILHLYKSWPGGRLPCLHLVLPRGGLLLSDLSPTYTTIIHPTVSESES